MEPVSRIRHMAIAPSITFAICVEPGRSRLEYKAAALLHSMRRNTGIFTSAAIWAYSPRPGIRVADWCRELLDHFEVRLIEDPLNAANANYALANKPLALAHAEEHSTTEYVVFLDSDILAWKPPVDLLLPTGVDMALVVDGTKTTASAGQGDPYEDYWDKMYALVGATARPFVTTTLTKERVRGTWNSGVVPLRRSAGIARQWRDAMLRMLAEDFSPRAASYLRENNLLSALAAARWDHFRELSIVYNYPVQSWRSLAYTGLAPSDAVLWHYQPFFDKTFVAFAERMGRTSGLAARLTATAKLVDDLRINYKRRVGLDETWLRSLRRRARLGPRWRALIGRPKVSDAGAD